MNRFNWTYIGDNNKKHHVGLMHGVQSGHLLVYCNSKIMLIDFQVLDDASYSFFIEDELCEISIERKGNQFLYGFDINRTADTPRNRQRRKNDKRHLIQSLLVLGGLGLAVFLFVYGFKYWNNVQDKVELADKLAAVGKETSATVIIASEGDENKISYFFLVDGKAYTVDQDTEEKGPIILECGMPLEKGDEFIVRYIPNNPSLHLLDYNRPTQKQLNIYRERAIDQYKRLHPNEEETYISCLTEIAFEFKGINGLADFYFQTASPDENPQHNINSFNRLIRDEPFKKEARKRCQFIQ